MGNGSRKNKTLTSKGQTLKKRGRSYSIMARVVIQIRMEKRKINSYTHTHTPLRVFIVGSYKEYRI